MIVGVVREIRAEEYRVALTPAGVEELVQQGHRVLVEQGAGVGSGFADELYVAAGAALLGEAAAVWAEAALVVKVKEPQPVEIALLRPGQMLFCFFHFAASRELTDGVLASGCLAVAYETVETADHQLPLLMPMSEVAGRMAAQQAAKYLERPLGGRGVLLGGAPGVAPATLVVLGGGTVGSQAARLAAGLGARVLVLDTHLARLRHLSEVLPANVTTLAANPQQVRAWVEQADAVISGVLVPGARAPRLVARETVARMSTGAVVVDVAIDQGGSLETSRPTSHRQPIYQEEGVIHYCVTNMPGAVPITATRALTNATLPYVLLLAELGARGAAERHPALARGINMAFGRLTCAGVGEAFGLPWVEVAAAWQ